MHNSSGLLARKSCSDRLRTTRNHKFIFIYVVSVPIKTRLIPPVDGRLGKGEERGEEQILDRIDVTTYMIYTEESKPGLSGSLGPVGRSVHNYDVGNARRWTERGGGGREEQL